MHLERMVPNIDRDLKADHPMTWDSYHSKADIDAYLTYLADKYTDLVSKYISMKTYSTRRKYWQLFGGCICFIFQVNEVKLKSVQKESKMKLTFSGYAEKDWTVL